MNELVKELWDAANVHCCVVHGVYLDEEFEATDEEPNPPMPEVEEAIRQVTEYLKSSI